MVSLSETILIDLSENGHFFMEYLITDNHLVDIETGGGALTLIVFTIPEQLVKSG